MARRGPRQLAQAASHRDQDMGAAARRARRRGVVVDRDPGRGQAQARVGRGAGRRVHGPGVASGRGPGRFRRGRRALQGRAPAHAPLRSGLPVPNIGLAQLMPGENAECTCQALLDLFEWLGGVPERIVFDNAAGVGRRTGGGGVRWTRLFQAFQAHYGSRAPVLAVRRTREGRGRGEGRHGPAQAVRAQTERVEPGELQLQTAGQVPGARREAPPRQGRGGGRPVRGGPRGPASPARGNVSTWSRGSA